MVSSRADTTGRRERAGLYLFFASGERPDVTRVTEAIDRLPQTSVSHVPDRAETAQHGINWMELLIDGMTFDLTGVAPGKPADSPDLAFRFDCPPEFLVERHSAVRLAPGPHLAAGAGSQPVVRSQAALASTLSEALPEVAALAWGPSQSLMGPAYFRSTVAAWLDGGPFPALALTAFRTTIDDAIQSVGLDHFTGQEVRLEPELVTDRADAIRLAVRLVNLLVGAGRLSDRERIVAPDGRTLRLEPSANGRFVRVFPE